MATFPEFEPFVIDSEQRSELTTIMTLGNLLIHMNEVYEYHELHDQKLRWDAAHCLELRTFPHSIALQLYVPELDKQSAAYRDIGYYDPAEGDHRIFPELMEDECDLGLLKLIARQKREKVINRFDKSADPSPRAYYDHPLVAHMHRFHNDHLINTRLAEQILY